MDRFKAVTKGFKSLNASNDSNGVTSPIDSNDAGRLLPVASSTKVSTGDGSDSGSISEYGKRFMVPEWVDVQDQIDDNFLLIVT